MEPKERLLVERVLGKQFLADTEVYGVKMKAQFVKNGATLSTAAALGRVAEIAFVKGAERFRSSLWHDFSKECPRSGKYVLCKAKPEEGNHLFLARLVNDGKGGMAFVDEDCHPTEAVSHWMDIPNVEGCG